jgi:hypothetical protein
MQPKPGCVICTNHYALVGVEHKQQWQEKEFPGVFGTWHNHDYGNVRRIDSYRAEVVNTKFIENMLASMRNRELQPAHGLSIDLRLLSAMSSAAKIAKQGWLVSIGQQGDPISFQTTDGKMTAILMPLHA